MPPSARPESSRPTAPCKPSNRLALTFAVEFEASRVHRLNKTAERQKVLRIGHAGVAAVGGDRPVRYRAGPVETCHPVAGQKPERVPFLGVGRVNFWPAIQRRRPSSGLLLGVEEKFQTIAPLQLPEQGVDQFFAATSSSTARKFSALATSFMNSTKT